MGGQTAKAQFAPRFSHSISHAFRRAGFVVAALVASPVGAQLTNLPPANLDLPNADFSLLRVAGALMVVVAVFLFGVWGFKQWQRMTLARGRTPKLNILEVKSLGNRTALYVVAYEQERLLLASSPQGVRMLTPLPPGGTEDMPTPAVAPVFVQTLDAALTAAPSGQGGAS